MRTRSCWLALVVAAVAWGAGKGPPKGEAANKTLRIEAIAHLDKESMRAAIGEEMIDGVVVVEVRLTPLGGEKVAVYLDDFLLRSDRDGQKSTPYTPSQIAGNSVLVVSNRYGGGGIATEDRGPVWGGIGGRPRRLPGSGGGIGSSSSPAEAVGTVQDETGKDKESPLLVALKKHVLAEKEISEAASGHLYFLMEGKHKVKDLELFYKGATGKLSVRFKQ